MKPLVVFSHGKESGPEGSKIKALAEVAQKLGWDTHSIDYRDIPEDATARVTRLVEYVTQQPVDRKLVLVGSSMGGYVSTVASMRLERDTKREVTGLFLMAPAFYKPGYWEQNPMPAAEHTQIVHGWADSVCPVEDSIRFATLYHTDLSIVLDNHFLEKTLPQTISLFETFLNRI